MGVNGDDSNTCKYTISISKYKCPMNCNNRGVCRVSDNGTRTCDCDKVSTESCLTLGVMLRQQLMGFGSYVTVVLQANTGPLLCVQQHCTCHPILLLKRTVQARCTSV